MKFTVATALLFFAVAPVGGFQLSMSSVGYLESMNQRQTSTPSYAASYSYGSSASLPQAASYTFASGFASSVTASPPSNGSYKKGAYSPDGRKMADSQSGNTYLDGLRGKQYASPSYTAPNYGVSSSYSYAATPAAPAASSSYSYASSVAPAAPASTVKRGNYSAAGKKMGDGRSGNSYLDGLRGQQNTSPSYAASSSSYSAPQPVTSSYLQSAASSSNRKNYSPDGRKMADSRSGNSYLDGLKGKHMASSSYAPISRPAAPAAASSSIISGPVASSYVKLASYMPSGRKMADSRSGNSYLDGLKGQQLSSASNAPAPSSSSTVVSASTASSSIKRSNYSPSGRKMADSRSGNSYLDGLKGKELSSPSYSSPSSYGASSYGAPATPAAAQPAAPA